MFIFTLVSKHPISACVFITIKRHHRVHPHFPSPRERISIPKSIQCVCNSLRYFGNTDGVHLACKQKSAGCRCLCAHVSVKNEEMQLGRGLMVTVAYNAYCVISKEGDDDTYDGKTVGSRSWEVGATVNSLVVTLFHVIITRTGTNLIFLSRLGSTICFTNFGSHDTIVLYWNPWYTEPCYKGSLLYHFFVTFIWIIYQNRLLIIHVMFVINSIKLRKHRMQHTSLVFRECNQRTYCTGVGWNRALFLFSVGSDFKMHLPKFLK